MEQLQEIAKSAGVPFILKGIMTVSGAEKAVEAGAAGIVVSNHGGRVLDDCPATAEVLADIVAAVDGRAKILVDGGIRTGNDVFKALALGADGVLIARPFVTAAVSYTHLVPHEFGFTQSLFNFYNRPLSEELWDAQVRAIREIADRESCVIVGRNADYILREFDHCLRVFVHADRNWRLLHMRKLMPDTPFEQLEADMDSADRARRSYCKQHTGQIYGDSRNYDLTLCTSKLGLDKAEEILLCAAKEL